MPSPNFDNLHLKFSRKIGDAVSSATTDGLVSSAQRTDYLGRANTQIQLFFKGRPDVEDRLGGLVGVSDVSDLSSITLPTDFSYDLRMYRVDAAARKNVIYHAVNPSLVPMILNRELLDYKNAYAIRGTTIEVYENFVAATGAGKFYYIKNDQRASANDSSDILINSLWFDTIVDIAALYYYLDKGQLEFAQVEQRVRDLITAVAK